MFNFFRNINRNTLFKTLYFSGSVVSYPYVLTNTLNVETDTKIWLFTFFSSIILWPIGVPLIYTGKTHKIINEHYYKKHI